MAAARSKRTAPSAPSRTEALYAFDRAAQHRLALADRSLKQGREEDESEAAAGRDSRRDLPSLAGCDEAGRGALAGPVVVACVHFPSFDAFPDRLDGLDDSKRLSARKRETLFERITTLARFGVGTATAAEVDRHGIVPACALAAHRAYRAMRVPVELLLLDRGLFLPPLDEIQGIPLPRQFALTKGDARSFHIASASILAKVTRDRMMTALDARFPIYAFHRNKGYGTAAHRETLQRCGPCPLHRLTYRLPAKS